MAPRQPKPEKQLFSRISRDQVDILWPILLKRSADRKYYEISTLKVKEVEPSEFRFCAFGSVKDLVNFEINLFIIDLSVLYLFIVFLDHFNEA